MQDYSFQLLEPGSGTYESNGRWCPGLEQPPSKAQSMRPLDGRFNFLLILGAQKAGTTWLFDALDTHPLFVGATHGYRCVADMLLTTRLLDAPDKHPRFVGATYGYRCFAVLYVKQSCFFVFYCYRKAAC